MTSVDLFDPDPDGPRDSADAEPLMTLLGQPVVQSSFSAVTIEMMGAASPLDSPEDIFSPSQEASDHIAPSKLPPVLDDVPSAAINNMRQSSASPPSDSSLLSSKSKHKSSTPSKGRRKNGNK